MMINLFYTCKTFLGECIYPGIDKWKAFDFLFRIFRAILFIRFSKTENGFSAIIQFLSEYLSKLVVIHLVLDITGSDTLMSGNLCPYLNYSSRILWVEMGKKSISFISAALRGIKAACSHIKARSVKRYYWKLSQ